MKTDNRLLSGLSGEGEDMGKFGLKNFPANESAIKMMRYLTEGFYDRSYVGEWLFQVMSIFLLIYQKRGVLTIYLLMRLFCSRQ